MEKIFLFPRNLKLSNVIDNLKFESNFQLPLSFSSILQFIELSGHFFQDVLGVRIVFLVAEPVNGDREDREEVQGRLIREAVAMGDILQPGLEDGHRKLGYKIISGEWRIQYCHLLFTEQIMVFS